MRVFCHRNKRALPKFLVVLFFYLLVGCQQEEASQETKEIIPKADKLEYAFEKPIPAIDDEFIFCTGARGSRGILNLIAIRINPKDIYGFERSEENPAINMEKCDLSKLSINGLNDFKIGKEEIKIGDAIRLNLQMPDVENENWAHVFLYGYDGNPVKDLLFEREVIEEKCSGFGKTRDKFGFYRINSDCSHLLKKGKRDFKNFEGVTSSDDLPASIICRSSAPRYPMGVCTINTWYNNQSVRLSFATNHLAHWRDVRDYVFTVLDEKVVAVANQYQCVGEFCKKMERQ